MSGKAYRLGLDIGTNSIGWAVIDIEKQKVGGQKEKRFVPISIRDMGARIFSDGRDPQDETSLAATRRVKRGARRRHDRYKARRTKLINALIRFGLMPENENERRNLSKAFCEMFPSTPEDKEPLNPYKLRAQAIKGEIHPYKLGRALYHLNQRRGFKSNRKTSSTKEDDKSETKQDIQNLREELKNNGLKTLGELFWDRCQNGEPVRARKGVGFNLERIMILNEFYSIQDAQFAHQKLAKKDWKELEKIIFFQRPLKPVMPGRCTIEPEQFRAPIALPSYQKFTIAQNLHNLELILNGDRRNKQKLNAEQWDKLWDLLQKQQKMKFSAIKNKLKLEGIVECNLETERRGELKGNVTSTLLSKKEYFGKKWFDFSDGEQDDIVEQLLHIEEPDVLIKKAQEDWGVSEACAHHLADLTPDSFPRGYARYCKTVLQKVTTFMVEGREPFHKASKKAGFHHSDSDPEANHDRLEYYGKWLTAAVVGNDPEKNKEKDIVGHYGRIPNPTVHIGLGQLMHVVNALIDRYGKPEEVIIELARELKRSYEQKQKERKIQRHNQQENRRIDKEVEQFFKDNGYGKPSRKDRIKYKLWEELATDPNDRKCPYSLDPISLHQLFSREDVVEEDHILPFSETLDNSLKNRTVCFASANKDKGRKSPAEAFDSGVYKIKYEDIMKQAGNLPPGKRWRFDPDAMDKFKGEGGFIDRAITDTAYLSRLSRKYMLNICPVVRVVPGQLTALLRYQWGLDEVLGKKGFKNRDDHRHNAIDAFVVGMTDQRMMQLISEANGSNLQGEIVIPFPFGEKDVQKIVGKVKAAVDKIIVSHRPDHSPRGQLHEDSVFSKIHPNKWEKEQGYNVVYRKPLTELKPGEINVIRSEKLRRLLIEHTHEVTGEKALRNALSTFAEKELEQTKEKNIRNKGNQIKKKMVRRHVRLLKKENPLVEVAHVQGDKTHVKAMAPGRNHQLSFWIMPPGKTYRESLVEGSLFPLKIKDGPEVVVVALSVYEANQITAEQLKPHPAAKLVLKVHKNDTLKLEHEGREVVARVESLIPRNKVIRLVDVKEGGKLDQRVKKGSLKKIFLSFSQIKVSKVRRVYVDPIGQVKDGGPVL